MIILCASAVFWQGTLYHFNDGSGNLTTLFFWPRTEDGSASRDYNYNHSGPHFWWFSFGDTADCEAANLIGTNLPQTCRILINVRYSNSFLVAGLAVAYFFTLLSTLFLVMMFCQKYYRITNIVLLIPALAFLTVPLVWYFVSDARLEET